MKNIVAAILLTALAGLGAYSFWSGMRTEQEFNDFVHRLGESPDVRVLSSDFSRGWVRSAGETEFEVSGEVGASFSGALTALGAEEARPRMGFRMQHHVEHGHAPLVEWLSGGMAGSPVVARVRTFVELDNEAQAELAAVLGRLPGLDIDTVVYASGVGESQVGMRAAELRKVDSEHAVRADWRGLSGTLRWSGGFSGVSGRFESQGFAGRGQHRAISVSGFEWNFEGTQGSEFLLGNVHGTLADLSVQDAETGASLFMLEGLEIAQGSRIDSGAYGADLTVALDTLVYQQKRYGPGLLELAVGGLDAEAMLQMRRTSTRLQSAGLAPELSEDARNAALAGELTALLPALLSREPHFEMKRLELITPEGPMRADARASVGEGMPAALNPLLLMGALQAELAAELPAGLLELIVAGRARQTLGPGEGEEYEAKVIAMRDAQIAELRSAGYVVFDGSSYRTRLLLRNGQLTVNGLPFQGFQATAASPAEHDLSMLR